MAHSPLRPVLWALPMLVVAAVVVVVLLLRSGSDGEPAAEGSGPSPRTISSTTPTTPITPTTPTTPPVVDPDTWCQEFLRFADANAQYVAAPDDPAAQVALQTSADELLALGRPEGLSDGGLTSLQVLVDGSLSQAGDPTIPPGTAPEDPDAFAAYLEASCPA